MLRKFTGQTPAATPILTSPIPVMIQYIIDIINYLPSLRSRSNTGRLPNFGTHHAYSHSAKQSIITVNTPW